MLEKSEVSNSTVAALCGEFYTHAGKRMECVTSFDQHIRETRADRTVRQNGSIGNANTEDSE